MSAPSILRRISERMVDKVPPKWLTTKQWQDRWSCSQSHAIHTCQRAAELGIMKRKMFRIRGTDGRVRPVPHFFEVKK